MWCCRAYTVAEEWHYMAGCIQVSVIGSELKIQDCCAREASSVAPTGSSAVCVPRQDKGIHSVALASMSSLLKKTK